MDLYCCTLCAGKPVRDYVLFFIKFSLLTLLFATCFFECSVIWQHIYIMSSHYADSCCLLLSRRKAWRAPCITPSSCTPASCRTCPRLLWGWRASWSRWGGGWPPSGSATASSSTPRWGWSEKLPLIDASWSVKRAGEDKREGWKHHGNQGIIIHLEFFVASVSARKFLSHFLIKGISPNTVTAPPSQTVVRNSAGKREKKSLIISFI